MGVLLFFCCFAFEAIFHLWPYLDRPFWNYYVFSRLILGFSIGFLGNLCDFLLVF